MIRVYAIILRLLFPVAVSALILASCGGGNKGDYGVIESDTAEVDSVTEPEKIPEPGDADFSFEDSAALNDYLESDTVAPAYEGGIMPVIAAEVPEYADKLIANQHDGFIVVDKASMRVILYDYFGHERRAYDMACAKNFGNKHKKADARTPEGFFSVEGIYDSTEWLFTDDNGVKSDKKGQYGPRFIRIKIPTTSQIGIHGTCAPWSIGHRTSHGCIRITNENILELVELVEPGMPVIILPGKKDRAVNREEESETPYFPTAPKYAKSKAERQLEEMPKEEVKEPENEVETGIEPIETEQKETEKEENSVDPVINPETEPEPAPESEPQPGEIAE